MRQIEVDVEVFALIWANRKSPEINENQILMRILNEIASSAKAIQVQTASSSDLALPEVREPVKEHQLPLRHESKEVFASKGSAERDQAVTISFGKTRWVDDVRLALHQIGGVASLHQIYRKVEEIRHSAGRSVPKTLEATIRRTIEDHSSDSENFRGVDVFEKVSRGEWALRKKT